MSPDELRRRLRLYVVLDPRFTPLDPIVVTRGCIAGGATAIQLRSKDASDRETLDLACEMRRLTAHAGILLIINDRIDLALAAEADGVHLGVDDLPLQTARELGGPSFLIGYSPGSDAQTADARADGADYLGVGPVFGTASKADAGPAIGLETIARRVELSGIPVIGIGGITSANVQSVLNAGACGVAVMSAVISSADPQQATQEIASELLEQPSPGRQ